MGGGLPRDWGIGRGLEAAIVVFWTWDVGVSVEELEVV